jgi:hypothetical protein
MRFDLVEKIVGAVLYEGYILYPYRPSSVKNRQRWNFGVLTPRGYSEAQGGTEAWSMQTECLARASRHTALDVMVRFLHLLEREVRVPIAEGGIGDQSSAAASNFRVVESLEVGGRLFQTWQEAVERAVDVPELRLSELARQAYRQTFTFPSSEETEPLRDERDRLVGVIVRRQQPIEGVVEVTAERVGEELFKVSVRVLNTTPLEDAHRKSRDEALTRATVSTHTVLGLRDGGELVSLLDPPESCRDLASACRNVGTWPVLVGEEGERGLMLSSPIILYDYPQVAPESAGDLFDGTEIDEILTLRIMTMTDEEKREMRGADERARRMLERTETMPSEQMLKLHGVMKGTRQP